MRRDPTEFRERFKRWKAGEKVYDAGTPTMSELLEYNKWVSNLPRNLLNSPNYDLYGAWKSGATPELQDDGFYHLPTRDPNTGLILKGDFHPTLLEGLAFDIDAGYHPKRENGRYYTRSWQDFKTVPEYDGGKTPEDDYTYYAGSLPTVMIEGHKPTLWENIGNWFVDASKRAAFNENPAVMTASGWTPYLDGTTKQDAFNTPERNQLADNLKEIGIMGASDVWGGPLTEYVVGKYALPFAYKTMTAVDNKLRNIYTPYDLLRTIETTTPSIDNLNKMWYQRELTFESPMKISRFHENPKVGDFIDYGFGQGVLKGVSRNTPLSELTELLKEAVQKLYTNPAVSGEWFPKYRGSKGSKLIHQNETGAQPTSSTGFVAKDATNSNSPWLSSMQGQPEIWYNRNKPYYSALGYRSYQDIPETLITNQEVAELLGLHFNGTHGKDVSRVLSAPEELPFNAVEYGIKPNIFGSFDRIVYQKPLLKIISPPYVRSIPENEKLVYKIQELAK